MSRARCVRPVVLSLCLASLALSSCKRPAKPPTPADLCPAGDWTVSLDIGTPLPVRFVLDVSHRAKAATVRHGGERLGIEKVTWDDETRRLTLAMPHYDSVLDLTADAACESLTGHFTKQKRTQKERLAASAVRTDGALYDAAARPAPLTLSYAMDFAQSGPAVGRFIVDKRGVATGTILTPTGDYRYLAGALAADGTLTVSAFDFSHVFLFTAAGAPEARLAGTFASGASFREAFTATYDPAASLDDDGFVPVGDNAAAVIEGPFVDLDGQPVEARTLQTGPRVVELFGTWCPNCNDAVRDLTALHAAYKDRGLQVTGLAFELTGDQARDLEQVRRYRARHHVGYPLYLAGVADKDGAAARLRFMDKVRAWPTTIFIDRAGQVAAVHTGYAGPATGPDWEAQTKKFKAVIEERLLKTP